MTFLKLREIVLCQYLLVIFSYKKLQRKTNQILLEISKFYLQVVVSLINGMLFSYNEVKTNRTLCKYQNCALDSSTSPHRIKQKQRLLYIWRGSTPILKTNMPLAMRLLCKECLCMDIWCLRNIHTYTSKASLWVCANLGTIFYACDIDLQCYLTITIMVCWSLAFVISHKRLLVETFRECYFHMNSVLKNCSKTLHSDYILRFMRLLKWKNISLNTMNVNQVRFFVLGEQEFVLHKN